MIKHFVILITSLIIVSGCSLNECDKLKNIPEINDCKIKKAVRENDIKVCDKGLTREDDEITNPNNQCYIGIAVNRKDYDICKKNISDLNDKMYCLASIADTSGNTNLCSDKADNNIEKDKCYQSYAMINNDASVCKMIKGVEESDACLFSVATGLKNGVICKDIVDQGKKEKCLKALEHLKNK